MLISTPPAIMGMYTDWGNLKVVSCVAWLNGAGPGSSTVQQEMGALGASIFRLRGWIAPLQGGDAALKNLRRMCQLGDAENFR